MLDEWQKPFVLEVVYVCGIMEWLDVRLQKREQEIDTRVCYIDRNSLLCTACHHEWFFLSLYSVDSSFISGFGHFSARRASWHVKPLFGYLHWLILCLMTPQSQNQWKLCRHDCFCPNIKKSVLINYGVGNDNSKRRRESSCSLAVTSVDMLVAQCSLVIWRAKFR